MRDFTPSGLVFLADGKTEIVRNFLHTVLDLRSQHKAAQGHELEPALLTASFHVIADPEQGERLRADFGDQAIGRVAPVDSLIWLVILPGIYVRHSDDRAFAEEPYVQRALKDILALCLQEGFEVFPTHRRIRLGQRQHAQRLPRVHPRVVVDWLPRRAGFLVDNLGPGRMDFRCFALGNLLAILFSITSRDEANRIMLLYAERWDHLIGEMPCKIAYPAVVGKEWQFLTGSDSKNAPWSYHNGGNWPVLLWAFVAAALKTVRGDLAQHAIETAESTLPGDHWPAHYDARSGQLIGGRAHLNQTRSAAGDVLAHRLVEDASLMELFPTADE